MSSLDVESARRTMMTLYTSSKQSHMQSFLAVTLGGLVVAAALQPLGILTGRPLLFFSLVVALVVGSDVLFLTRWFWYGVLESYAPSTIFNIKMSLSGPTEPVQSQVSWHIVDRVRGIVRGRELFLLRRWLVALGDTGQTPRLAVVCTTIWFIVFIALLLLLPAK